MSRRTDRNGMGDSTMTDAWTPHRRRTAREVLALTGAVRTVGRAVPQPPASTRTAVLLIPGFLAGDWSLRGMSRQLRYRGHRTFDSGIRSNVGCTSATVEQLERRLETIAAHTGPVAIVGHSRGGTLGRLLTTRRPDLVRGIVTLGSPLTTQFAASTSVLRIADEIARRNRTDRPTVLSDDCLRGSCAEQTATALAEPMPAGMAFTSIYSRTDGVVRWHACLDPSAEAFEVRSTHNGMAVNRSVIRLVERRLALL
ncbi:esterase/lipase family protein [Gordonia sp. NPDC003424]